MKEDTVTLKPTDDKIEGKELGSADNKRYLNESPAKAKTQLSPEEFKKPQPDVTDIRQPIPAEYWGVLTK